MISTAVFCIALNVYFEARNEPLIGKVAVAQVVMNRSKDIRFPSDVCDVVTQGETIGNFPKRHRCQFSWYCDGLSDDPLNIESWDSAVAIATWVSGIGLVDVTGGALWYHTVEVSPKWATTDFKIIGSHKFYSEVN